MTEPPGLQPGATVRLRDVRRTFASGLAAIAGISLDISAGEFVAILGPSGCGKTTLLRLIAGLDAQQAGSIELSKAGIGSTTRPRIAYVFQDATLLPWRTVAANVCLPLEFMGVPKPQRRRQADAALAAVGLAAASAMYPAQLSGGMRMRVSLARALVTDPDLLLLDEPFAAVDEITRQNLDEQLRSLWKRQQTTVIFVTHSTTEATFLAQRAIVLSARPAQVVLDTPIDLPDQRSAVLRGEAIFARQSQSLYQALSGRA
jgi:NitT/TauT family transport system ATP-binding protein